MLLLAITHDKKNTEYLIYEECYKFAYQFDLIPKEINIKFKAKVAPKTQRKKQKHKLLYQLI